MRANSTRAQCFLLGAFAGAGFAFLEALLYGLGGISEDSLSSWWAIMLIRGGSTSLHVLCTGLAGLGWWYWSRAKQHRTALALFGGAMLIHAAWNAFATIISSRIFYLDTLDSKKEAIRFATIDSSVALMSALFINAAILIVAAAVFHGTDHESVADIGDAYKLLSPLLGTTAAGVLFAVALLCSGQNATLTGTLAGQIVMEGFVNIRLRPWLRRLITRLVAIVPAVIVVILYGERGTGALLVLSQVILSLQLPFAVFPLVSFTTDRRKMGALVAPRWIQILAWSVAVIIAALNAYLLYQTFTG